MATRDVRPARDYPRGMPADRPDDDALHARRPQAMRDVGGERRVAAFVLDDRDVVDPNAGVIIDGSEMQEHTLTAALDVREIR